MFCENCGTKIAEGSKFCVSCGARVGEEAVASPVTAQVAPPPAVAHGTPAPPPPPPGAYAAPVASVPAPAAGPPPAAVPSSAQPAMVAQAAPTQPLASADTAPLSMGQYLVMMLLLSVPLLNLFLLFKWGFGSSQNVNKKNLARAFLVMMLISLVFAVLARGVISRAITSAYYY